MPMSDEEQRQLREIESHLTQQPRLVKLARQLSAADVYTALRRLAAFCAAGGAVGLVLLVVGAVLHNALFPAGVLVLAGTQLIVGVAAIVVEGRAGPSGSRRRRQDQSSDRPIGGVAHNANRFAPVGHTANARPGRAGGAGGAGGAGTRVTGGGVTG